MIKALILRSEYNRNILTLITGTAFAQAIPLFMTPILTRLYNPDDFGVFAIYLALVSILSIAATGRYEQAILLPKNNEDAANLTVLACLFSLVISSVFFIIILIFSVPIANFLGKPELESWLYLVPLSIIFTGIYQSFVYWNNRTKQYKKLAVNRSVQSGVCVFGQSILGPQNHISGGLIFGFLCGQLVSLYSMIKSTWQVDKPYFSNVTPSDLVVVAMRYIKFPKFLVFSHMLNVAAFQLPILFMSSLFSSVITGFYFLTQKMLAAPLSIISNAVGDVFRQQASVDYHKNGNCCDIYVKTFQKLSLAIIPLGLCWFYLPEVFAFVFGEEWAVSGEYAQLLLPMYYLSFICGPLSNMFIICEKQKLDLYFQSVFICSSILPFALCFIFKFDIKTVVVIYSCLMSFLYISNILISYKLSKGVSSKDV